jgi:ATP-dependent DNA ligase
MRWPRIGEQMPTPPDNQLKSYLHFYAHCSATAKAQAKYTRRQNIERYRRLLKSATDKERRDYLNRLILEEQQKQKDAGDSDYQY